MKREIVEKLLESWKQDEKIYSWPSPSEQTEDIMAALTEVEKATARECEGLARKYASKTCKAPVHDQFGCGQNRGAGDVADGIKSRYGLESE